MKEIASPKDLHNWLLEQPSYYSKVIAARAAMRAFPYLSGADEEWLSGSILSIIRVLNVVRAPGGAKGYSAQSNIFKAYEAAEYGTHTTSTRISIPGEGHPTHPRLSAASSARGAIIAAAQVANTSLRPIAATFAESAAQAAVNAASIFALNDPVSGDFGRAVYAEAFAAAFWQTLNFDCGLLTSKFERGKLEHTRLWVNQPPGDWIFLWGTLKERLLEIDPNYIVWTEWFDRRISGEWAAFNIPGDDSRAEDTAILARLADATDEDFWGKGHEYVNATLKGWLEEARARVIPAAMQSISELSNVIPPIPTQNTNAISFRADQNGKISIDAKALADQLRADGGAQDRHTEAVAEAKIVLDRCQRSNAGARLTRLLENYLEAAGEVVAETKPSLLVQRGERLRQELAAYENPDSFLDPLADDLLLDMKGWQSAHNMLIGLDPLLNAMDVAMLGPDQQPMLIPPDEIKQIAHEADDADLLQDGVVEIIEEAAELAPAIPDANDRHTVWSTEMVRNLTIETASIALNHPIAASAVVIAGSAVVATVGVGGLGAISLMGSVKAAEYLVTHKEWVLSRLGNTPTWQALIASLADWLGKVTPFEPK